MQTLVKCCCQSNRLGLFDPQRVIKISNRSLYLHLSTRLILLGQQQLLVALTMVLEVVDFFLMKSSVLETKQVWITVNTMGGQPMIAITGRLQVFSVACCQASI